MINFLVMVLMRDILVKGELLRENALTDQKKESQLAHYRDMQAASALAERLTESMTRRGR